MIAGSSDLPAWARIDYKFYFVGENGDRACVGDSSSTQTLNRDQLKQRALLCRDKLTARFKQKFRTMKPDEVDQYIADQKAAGLAKPPRNVK